MVNINQNDINDLEKYLSTNEDTTKSEEEVVPNGNITTDEIRAAEQILFYLIVEKSKTMYYNGLEKGVVDGLNEVKKAVNGDKESKCIQTAMTFFGDIIDMRPFKYGESIDTTYEANESGARMYDAIVKSCINMTSQYDRFVSKCKIKGVMLIITDDGEFGGSYHDLSEAIDALNELKKREIACLVATCDSNNSLRSSKRLGVEAISIKDQQQVRILMKTVSQNLCL